MRAPLVLAVLVLILAAPIVPAGIIHVPGDYPNIQDAIDAAVDGDTVLVAPDTYVENLDFLGKAITVRSDADGNPATHDPDPDNTIVDGNQAGSVVVFQSGEGLDSVLEGFTITNGSGTYDSRHGDIGGGVFCTDSSPTIQGNKITANGAHFGGGISCSWGAAPLILGNTISANSVSGSDVSGGGGIFTIGASPEITGNTITGNTATGNLGGWGGGIYVWRGTSCAITHNTIAGNSAIGTGHDVWPSTGGGISCRETRASPMTVADNVILQNTAEYGGGVFCWLATAVVLERNQISENRAEGGGYSGIYGSSGGGIDWSDSVLLISNNVLSGNFSDDMGGALHGHQSSSPSLVFNNTIHGNRATNLAGGLSLGDGSVATVANTILWDNDAPTGPEMAVILSSTLSIEYTDLEGGQPSVYVEAGSNLNWGAGMIDVDPGLVDPVNGNFELVSTSPCIDAGNDDVECCDLDLVGNPRVLDGLLDEVMIVDMGACEFDHVHLEITGSATPGGTLTINTTGTAGMPVFLFVGTAPGEVCLPRYGCLFLELSSSWYVVAWGTIPSSVTVTIPPAFPVPLDLVVQELALDPDPGSRAGNTSNPVELTIE